ncbi:MAG: SDR family oxidoreductase [Rhodobiaceae bacterium]|nr:SDR family oxidoreductase [Rhodobiaceae bacterium]MCC0056600.1 SDR family oxidoreductase [Rhodobiaceae bacterium]
MSDTSRHEPLRFEDASVLITGGTSGVGLATAIRFAEKGVRKIALNGRNAERGAAACDKVKKAVPGADVRFFAGDGNKLAEVKAVCEGARSAFGSVDILINSTIGGFGPDLFHNIPEENIEPMAMQQFLPPLLASRIVYPWMREKNNGVIISIASDAGKSATPGESVLGGAMAGIIMFTRGLAMEAKRNNIRVNVMTPSIIEGTMTYDEVMAGEFSGKLFAKAIKMAQLGVVNPDDMANMIVFLASPECSKVTGQAVSVNGGISAA